MCTVVCAAVSNSHIFSEQERRHHLPQSLLLSEKTDVGSRQILNSALPLVDLLLNNHAKCKAWEYVASDVVCTHVLT